MNILRQLSAGVAVAALTLSLSTPSMAKWPNKAIEFIIPFGAGGGADIEGRVLAKEMSKVLGVPVVAINKPGAGGAKTYTYVKNTKPDGNTMAFNSTSILTTTNIGNVPFKHSALAHIGRIEFQPLVFAVKYKSKWKSFKSFVKDCRKNPGKYKLANSGTGSSTHLGALAFTSALKCKMIHLPVGVKRRNATLLSGEAEAMVAPLTAAVRLAKAKKNRLLVSAAENRNKVIPKVPTAKELGFDAEIHFFRGISVPKGTSKEIKVKLAQAMTAAAESNAFRSLSKKKGFTIAPLPVDQFEELLRVQDKKVVRIMKDAGILGMKRKK
ncbi:MAG: Bug family tripartite tricarboxylate transporter substrate binding protein [Rhodospirillales bacterium]|jgi:tripartite-type tricarboxylate transporter receptor subunit TctC